MSVIAWPKVPARPLLFDLLKGCSATNAPGGLPVWLRSPTKLLFEAPAVELETAGVVGVLGALCLFCVSARGAMRS